MDGKSKQSVSMKTKYMFSSVFARSIKICDTRCMVVSNDSICIASVFRRVCDKNFAGDNRNIITSTVLGALNFEDPVDFSARVIRIIS